MSFWAIALAAALAAAPVAEIDHAIDAGRFDQARLMIAKSIQDGASAESLEPALAKLAFRSGAFAEALARYEKLSIASPGDVALAEHIGMAALALGQDDKALAALSRATASPLAGWRAWNAMGVLADRDGDFAQARAAYGKAQAIAPSRAEVLNNLGWSYFLEGKPAQALPYLERAVAIDPKAALYADNVEIARAAIAADLPRRRASESPDAYAARLNDLGVVALTHRQKRKAIAAFSQAIAVRGDYYARAANNLKAAEAAK